MTMLYMIEKEDGEQAVFAAKNHKRAKEKMKEKGFDKQGYRIIAEFDEDTEIAIIENGKMRTIALDEDSKTGEYEPSDELIDMRNGSYLLMGDIEFPKD